MRYFFSKWSVLAAMMACLAVPCNAAAQAEAPAHTAKAFTDTVNALDAGLTANLVATPASPRSATPDLGGMFTNTPTVLGVSIQSGVVSVSINLRSRKHANATVFGSACPVAEVNGKKVKHQVRITQFQSRTWTCDDPKPSVAARMSRSNLPMFRHLFNLRQNAIENAGGCYKRRPGKPPSIRYYMCHRRQAFMVVLSAERSQLMWSCDGQNGMSFKSMWVNSNLFTDDARCKFHSSHQARLRG